VRTKLLRVIDPRSARAAEPPPGFGVPRKLSGFSRERNISEYRHALDRSKARSPLRFVALLQNGAFGRGARNSEGVREQALGWMSKPVWIGNGVSPPQSRTQAGESPSPYFRQVLPLPKTPTLHYSNTPSSRFLLGPKDLRNVFCSCNPQPSIFHPQAVVHVCHGSDTGCHGSCHGSMLRKCPSLLICHGVTAPTPPRTGAGPQPKVGPLSDRVSTGKFQCGVRSAECGEGDFASLCSATRRHFSSAVPEFGLRNWGESRGKSVSKISESANGISGSSNQPLISHINLTKFFGRIPVFHNFYLFKGVFTAFRRFFPEPAVAVQDR
jgi:hypothetical protein